MQVKVQTERSNRESERTFGKWWWWTNWKASKFSLWVVFSSSILSITELQNQFVKFSNAVSSSSVASRDMSSAWFRVLVVLLSAKKESNHQLLLFALRSHFDSFWMISATPVIEQDLNLSNQSSHLQLQQPWLNLDSPSTFFFPPSRSPVPESSTLMNSNVSSPFFKTQPNSRFQLGSWTDRKISSMERTLRSYPTVWTPSSVMTLNV